MQRKRQIKLELERLEQRDVPATLSIVGTPGPDDCLIRDFGGGNLQVVQSGKTTSYRNIDRVTADLKAGNDMLDIQYLSGNAQRFTDYDAKLGAGNDKASIMVPGGLPWVRGGDGNTKWMLYGGDGNDQFFITMGNPQFPQPIDVGGDVRNLIQGGAGNDSVWLKLDGVNFNAATSFDFMMDDGHDSIDMELNTLAHNYAWACNMLGGAGNEMFDISAHDVQYNAPGQMMVNTEGGNDVLNAMMMDLAHNYESSGMSLLTGEGNNITNVDMRNVKLGRSGLLIGSENGNDHVAFSFEELETAYSPLPMPQIPITVQTNGGNDMVEGIIYPSAGSPSEVKLDVELGNGNDQFNARLINSSAPGSHDSALTQKVNLSVQGGAGNDILRFRVDEYTSQGDVTVMMEGEAGNDQMEVLANELMSFGLFGINTQGGDGHDQSNVAFTNIQVFGPMSVELGGGHGNDDLRILYDQAYFSSLADFATDMMDGGFGNDILVAQYRNEIMDAKVSLWGWDAGAGDDVVIALHENYIIASPVSAQIDLGDGTDYFIGTFVSSAIQAAHNVDVNGEGGNDFMFVAGSNSSVTSLNDMSMNTGDGNDGLFMANGMYLSEASINEMIRGANRQIMLGVANVWRLLNRLHLDLGLGNQGPPPGGQGNPNSPLQERLRFVTGAGDDAVFVRTGLAPMDMEFGTDLGRGNDSFDAEMVAMPNMPNPAVPLMQSVTARGGEGRDKMAIKVIGGRTRREDVMAVSLNGDAGDDEMSVSISDLHSAGEFGLMMDGDDGNDLMKAMLQKVTIDMGGFIMQGGQGNNMIRADLANVDFNDPLMPMAIMSGDGNDSSIVIMQKVKFAGSAFMMHAGNGNNRMIADLVDVEHGANGNPVTMVGGDGNDIASVRAISTQALNSLPPIFAILFDLGNGTNVCESTYHLDLLRVSGAAPSKVNVTYVGGAGRDFVTVNIIVTRYPNTIASFFRVDVSIDGGMGDDVIDVLGSDNGPVPTLSVGVVNLDVLGGDGDDILRMIWPETPNVTVILDALADGGDGTDGCIHSPNVSVINCEW